MNLFIAFAINIGNLGKNEQKRPPQIYLMELWNAELAQRSTPSVKFIDYYFSTGNFVLVSEQGYDVESVSAHITRHILSHKFAIFRYDDLSYLVALLDTCLDSSPPDLSGRRWTPGLIMDINTNGAIPAPFPSDRKAFCTEITFPRIRLVWKGDILEAQSNKLDRRHKSREGGWGSLAKRMKALTGTDWTARSMKTVKGALSTARYHISHGG